MDKIQVKVLNPEAIETAEKMMVCAARLTQAGHNINSMQDFEDLYNKDVKESTMRAMAKLPHPTIQKFSVINVVVVGASRRFLAQITRHQNEVKFMSASLQYSDYRGKADVVVPYNLLGEGKDLAMARGSYITKSTAAIDEYEELIGQGLNHDEAAYIMPQGLRNVLIISATPYQWKHIIKQRICRRNTIETRYVMLKIWQALYYYSDILFGEDCLPDCATDCCKEGKFCCGCKYNDTDTPTSVLKKDFNKIKEINNDTGKV